MARSEGMLAKAKSKLKKGANYVNDNINPLTSKKNKKAGADYVSKAKTGSLAGKVLNADTRMARLGGASKKKGKK